MRACLEGREKNPMHLLQTIPASDYWTEIQLLCAHCTSLTVGPAPRVQLEIGKESRLGHFQPEKQRFCEVCFFYCNFWLKQYFNSNPKVLSSWSSRAALVYKIFGPSCRFTVGILELNFVFLLRFVFAMGVWAKILSPRDVSLQRTCSLSILWHHI